MLDKQIVNVVEDVYGEGFWTNILAKSGTLTPKFDSLDWMPCILKILSYPSNIYEGYEKSSLRMNLRRKVKMTNIY